MKPGRKLLLLALSLLLPVVLLVCTHGFVVAQMRVAAHDRALVWVQGAPQDIRKATSRIETHATFSGGKVAAHSTENPAPEPCHTNAVELSFGNLSLDDSQAAREELELIAEQSGLVVCANHRFRINDPGADTPAGQLRFAGQHLLMFLGIPAGVCLCLYWMFREQFDLPRLHAGHELTRNVLLGLGGAVLIQLVALGIRAATVDTGPAVPVPAHGAITMAMVLALTLGSPVIEEIAYRGWLIPLSERVLGSWPAAVFSTLLFTLSCHPGSVGEALGLLTLGGVCSALYLRTRSILAPVIAHAGFALFSLVLRSGFGWS